MNDGGREGGGFDSRLFFDSRFVFFLSTIDFFLFIFSATRPCHDSKAR